MIRYSFLFLMVLFTSVNAMAAEAEPKLENYDPPPMFDSSAAPLTGAPAVPRPALKIQLEEPEPEPEKIVPPKPVVTAPKIIIANPPLPPKRPKVFHASPSFIEKARADAEKPAEEKPVATPVKEEVPAKFIDIKKVDDVDTAMDKELELVQPTPKEVLDSLDSNKPIARTDAPAQAIPDNIKPGDKLSFGYQPEVTQIPEEIKATLIKVVQVNLKASPNLRIEVQAFASAKDGNESGARRVSLARALDVRKILIDNKIDAANINIRPLGDQTKEQPVDRVDIIFHDSGK